MQQYNNYNKHYNNSDNNNNSNNNKSRLVGGGENSATLDRPLSRGVYNMNIYFVCDLAESVYTKTCWTRRI